MCSDWAPSEKTSMVNLIVKEILLGNGEIEEIERHVFMLP